MNKDMLNQLLDKLKLRFQSIKTKLPSKPNLQYQQENQDNKLTKLTLGKTLAGLSIGFILGAIGSSVVLDTRIKQIQKEYENAQLMFHSKLKSCQRLSTQYIQNTPAPSNVLSVMNTLPSSDIFASFYAKLIKDKDNKQEKNQEQKPQRTHEQTTLASASAPPPVNLPPLKSLVGTNPPNNNQPENNLQWIMPGAPPTPQVSVIACSNNNTNCYAVSSDGTVYTNGYTEGNYKLVVTPSQVYWVKIHRKHTEN